MNFFNNYLQNSFQQMINNQIPKLNPEQFKQMINKLDENTLNSLVQQAQSLGMSNEQIQEGLKYIQSMK